jgi:hypothetical protein
MVTTLQGSPLGKDRFGGMKQIDYICTLNNITMVKVIKTPTSITIRKDGNYLSIVKQGTNIVFMQSLDASEVKAGNTIQHTLLEVLRGEDSKTNYQKRFSKLGSLINEHSQDATFRSLSIRLVKATAELV